ncbi:MAG: bile acid:sodium symporter family protein [Leptospiraceae bacterium]|nr:bile acid:sodium symporter family protein [Leptospiraceae bacterium]NUM42271.1 bile acid:sodium symporter family protein [Leptospiraceae bacterium]
MQLTDVGKLLLPVMLFLVMFGMGLGLQVRDFKRVLVTPWQVAIGSFGHFVIMPIAAIVVIKLLKIEDPKIAIGIILVGASPSGATSNLVNALAKTDVALAIVITALSTLLCPFLTPLAVKVFGGFLGYEKEIVIPFLDMLKFVIVIIALPVLTGMFLRWKFPKLANKMEKPFKIFGLLVLIFIIVYVIYQNRLNFLNIVATVGVAVVLHNTFGLMFGYFASRGLRVPKKQSRTISIEMGIQNTTLSLTLAVNFFDEIVAMPPALFSLWMYIAGIALAFYWAKFRPLKEEVET